MSEEIVVRIEGRAGRITLNRPDALNSLTYDMLRAIDAAGDRAFAAGGDIVDLYNTGRAGDFGFGQTFWAYEYWLNARIARYSKPYVAIMHGFVMGGGVGVSALGSHRIVTDGSQVAMPEVGIGLVPDVGGSKILADAPGRCGEYLGMTATRMGPADAIYAGFADTYVPVGQLEAVKAKLVVTGDVSVIADFSANAEGGELAYFQLPIDDAFEAASPVELEAKLEDAAAAGL
ncbi:MAG: enoyl-CoA hydratase/isomerase family protein, partial [Pseudomonadota bacterium]